MCNELYSFIMKGELTKANLKKLGLTQKKLSLNIPEESLYKSLSIDLLDDNFLPVSKNMSMVYIAISTFENMVRKFIKKVLIEEFGCDWDKNGLTENIKNKANSRMVEDLKIKWHDRRGEDIMSYIDFQDLSKIMINNRKLFEDFVYSIEWASSIFDTISKSRNVIMHSGELSKEDIERIGIHIRDWVKQVGN